MICTVCESDIVSGEELFANDWERLRRRLPCCSVTCCAGFNPDEHWMPGEEPSAATPDDVRRLVGVARQRLRDGDRPTMVVRELFVAGVPPDVVRGLLDGALVGVAQSQKQNREGWWMLLLGWWMLLLTGIGVFKIGLFKREKRDENLVGQAYAAIEQWRLRGKRWKQNRDLGASARLR
jgi:hypothetical protein